MTDKADPAVPSGEDQSPDAEAPSTPSAFHGLLHDVPLDLAVELGRVKLNLRDLAARLGPGSIIPLNSVTGDTLDVRVNGRLVARAEAVAVGERCGVRIVEIVSGGEADRA